MCRLPVSESLIDKGTLPSCPPTTDSLSRSSSALSFHGHLKSPNNGNFDESVDLSISVVDDPEILPESGNDGNSRIELDEYRGRRRSRRPSRSPRQSRSRHNHTTTHISHLLPRHSQNHALSPPATAWPITEATGRPSVTEEVCTVKPRQRSMSRGLSHSPVGNSIFGMAAAHREQTGREKTALTQNPRSPTAPASHRRPMCKFSYEDLKHTQLMTWLEGR